jgi:cytochrome c biogenesis protein CcmG/thiol:disulfide interchange protein DsbE
MAEAKRGPNWLLLMPLGVFAGLAGLFLSGMVFRDPASQELPSALAGQPAPPFAAAEPLGDLPPLDDAALRAGEVTLVNFFASWCPPCRVEHPNLVALAAEGIPILGVAYKDAPDDSLAFLDELGNPYAAAGADPRGRLGLDWGLYGVPETFVIAGDGTIIGRIPGPVTDGSVEERLRALIAEAAAR